jgi:sortase B
MKNEKRIYIVKTVIYVMLSALAGILVCWYLQSQPVNVPAAATDIPTVTPAATPTALPENTADAQQTADYAARKTINPDYVGELVFDSGLIDQNVVKGTDNQKYLTLTWDLKDDSSGSAFMDSENSLDDQNVIIYGHYVYRDITKMFSPLHDLKDQKNYEADKDISLKLGNKTMKYEVTDVFYYTMNDKDLAFYMPNYTEEYFNLYYAKVKTLDFYDTGKSLSYSDHWLTLQTYVRDRDDLRLIVLAKLIED